MDSGPGPSFLKSFNVTVCFLYRAAFHLFDGFSGPDVTVKKRKNDVHNIDKELITGTADIPMRKP